MTTLSDAQVAVILARLGRARLEHARLWDLVTDSSTGPEDRSRHHAKLTALTRQVTADLEKFHGSGRCTICLKPADRPHTRQTRSAHNARTFRAEDPLMCPEPTPATAGESA